MDTGMQIEYAHYNRPFLGERVSGDLPILNEDKLFYYAVLLDSLGHGKEASAMSEIISGKLKRCWSPNPSNIILDINTNLDLSLIHI